ncbi:hypothetical protein [Cohnella abietis]|uniref:Uncharacterized protein n=1 Tax=Cohnella abietis TaxID=2507935 RepID=A0A3T1DA32_9BACL|nr:hypothetical protein [Cohnella abietis]BBI34962.1 hypothetical protein KCTCHS21_43610 [Cohnella abietis]
MSKKHLSQYQEKQRQESIKKLKKLIELIQVQEGQYAVLTLEKLLNYGGNQFYKSLLYKEHLLKIWNPRLWEHKYARRRGFGSKQNDVDYKGLKREIEGIEKKLRDSEKALAKLKAEHEDLMDKYKGARAFWKEEKEISAKLRGEILQLQSRLAARGL